jgi:hypothetical protein
MQKKSNTLVKNLVFLFLSINTVVFYAFALKKYQERIVVKNDQAVIPLAMKVKQSDYSKKSLK